MKTTPPRRSLLHPAALLAATLLIGGCLQERLAWSPDGRHAAILTADGLYLSDANGHLSPLLVPGAYRVAWLPDSQHLVLARKKPAKTFADVAAALGPERTRALVAKAELLGRKIKDLPKDKVLEKQFVAGLGDEVLEKHFAAELGDDLEGILAYLREQPSHLAALRAKFGAEWKREDESKPADLNEVVMARVTDSALEFGPTLFVGLPKIHSLRPAPGGRAIAFTMQTELSPFPDNGICVLLAPVDASGPAVTVATQGTTDPDWTRDGRSLVFFKASGNSSTGDDLRLGALVRREVLDATGQIQLAEAATDLAGLIFHQQNRVRCLSDGRVLFNASPFSLPTTGDNGNDREQFFLLDGTAKATLRPLIPPAQLAQLPKALSVFEVSPDESQVLVSADDSASWLVTLATGTVERVTAKLERVENKGEGNNYPAPVWRKAGEITFLRRTPTATGTFELVLRRGSTDTVLSKNWDQAILRQLIK